MIQMQKGQKLKLTDLAPDGRFCVSVSAALPEGETDVTCFGVDGAGKLSDDRYFVFYNQTRTPEGAVEMTQSSRTTEFSIDLHRLPAFVQKLVVTVALDGGVTMRKLTRSLLTIKGEREQAEYTFDGGGFQEEKAIILCELYRREEFWRCAVVASGFNGGLSALLAHFGGEEVRPAEPAPPVPKVNLSKISLKKSGESHKIDLSKNAGRIHVNLNWDRGRPGLFKTGADVDLDLACMYRLKNGTQGVIQALGRSFGSASDIPYIRLDGDDRSGAALNGENMDFFRPELIDFAVVFAYIYDGVPNWRSTNARVVLSQEGAPDIEILIDNARSNARFCVLASLTGRDGGLEVRREERFFNGHREVDQHYGFGFRWVAGRK